MRQAVSAMKVGWMRTSVGGTVNAIFHSSSMVSGCSGWVLGQEGLDSFDCALNFYWVAVIDVPGDEAEGNFFSFAEG